MTSQIETNAMYEQIIHDQSLYCATEINLIFRELGKLSREQDSKERRQSAKRLDDRLSIIASKCMMLEYMYNAANRADLKELVMELFGVSTTEATTAMTSPEEWASACSIANASPEPIVRDVSEDIRDWRLKFLSAIKG